MAYKTKIEVFVVKVKRYTYESSEITGNYNRSIGTGLDQTITSFTVGIANQELKMWWLLVVS